MVVKANMFLASASGKTGLDALSRNDVCITVNNEASIRICCPIVCIRILRQATFTTRDERKSNANATTRVFGPDLLLLLFVTKTSDD